MARFYEPTEGEVLIDGRLTTDYNLKFLRRQIGFVLQEAFLFSTTIRDNIAFGNPHATKEQVIEAAKSAQDRKSTRLNSSHVAISYAVFCLKKKKKKKKKKTKKKKSNTKTKINKIRIEYIYDRDMRVHK